MDLGPIRFLIGITLQLFKTIVTTNHGRRPWEMSRYDARLRRGGVTNRLTRCQGGLKPIGRVSGSSSSPAHKRIFDDFAGAKECLPHKSEATAFANYKRINPPHASESHLCPSCANARPKTCVCSATGRASPVISPACPASRRYRARAHRCPARPSHRPPMPPAPSLRTARTSSCAARGSRPSPSACRPAVPADKRT